MERVNLINTHFNSQLTSNDYLKVAIKDNIAIVEFAPPTKLIFLTQTLFTQINSELESLEKNPEVSVVILTGRGNSFATGADINELNTLTLNKMVFDDYFERTWWRMLPKFRKPLIAAVNG
jgi:enoyl-CoA hydratase/carnithine racemase